MTRTRARALTAALAIVTGAGGCITDRIVVEGEHEGAPARVDRAQYARVEKETARLRHLPFLEEVPAEVMTVQQLREWFDGYADARKVELTNEDRFYHRLGILPPTTNTAEAYKGFLADFVGGVYDDGAKRMVLVSDYAWWAKAQQDAVGVLTGVDWAYEVFLAHELVHALQDQHFGLGDMLKGGVYEDNDDAAFVRKTILETEANIVGMAHFLGMDLEQLATRKSFFLFMRYNNLLNGPLLMALAGRTPSFFAKQGFSQYELGLSFVERKLDEGGMDALSRAYVRVPGTKGAFPESTEQLLWPRKMRADTLDRPIPIKRLAGPPSSLPGSRLVLTNVFGALAFKHWLEDLDPLAANAVADGWGGDRFDIVDDGGESVLVWRTTWDSDDDAREFASAYAGALPGRYGGRAQLDGDGARAISRFVVPAAPAEERAVRTDREERALVERRGKDVLVLEGVAPGALDALAAEMWTALAPDEPPRVDTEKLAAKAKALEEHLGHAERAPERPDLLGRLFLPARTMAVRAGTGLGAFADGGDVRLLTDSETRWGFRPHLELSLPLTLAGELRTPFGQTVVSASLTTLFTSITGALQVGHAVALGDDVVVVGQAALDDIGGAGGTRFAAGALLRPLPAIVVAPAAARLSSSAGTSVVLGSALRRGAALAPLLELEIVDGLFVYEATSVIFDEKPRGLALRAHTHVLGLLLYF